MPGKPFFPFVSWSLWQGPDHLLWVSSSFFKERYRRFYYNDIQSIILQRTGNHWIWTCVWGALALLFGIIASAVSGTAYVSGTFSVIFLAALLTNILMGPSCNVFLQTAVQLQRISSLRRVRTANKALEKIKVLVNSKQGAWQKEISVAAQNNSAPSRTHDRSESATAAPAQKEGEAAAPKGPYKPLFHQILFGLLLIMGILGSIQILIKSLPIGLLETLLHGAAQVMVIVALVRWFRHLKGTAIAKLNWLALVFVIIVTVIGYVFYFVVSFQNPEYNYNHWAMFKMMFELQMSDHSFALAANIIYAGGNLLLGLFGLLVLQRQIRS
jgi:hypothetical protein